MGAANGARMKPSKSNMSYTYEGADGWRRWRVLRPGRGMYHDVRRRLPYYWSDIKDAFTYRTIASIIRMYFVNLLPALAYTLDMYRRTGEFFGINEALFSSALAAMVFSILAAQPLTIVGVTGLIALFNYTIYDIIEIYDVSIYPQFMAWVGIWAAIFHWLVAVGNACDYMRYVTDFSSEAFGMYVGIIYIIKGVEELVNEFTQEGRTAGFLAVMIAILYFGTVYGLEKLGSSTVWRAGVRGILADYAYVFGTIFWVGFSHIPGNIDMTHIMRLPTTAAFKPTQSRSWLIDFWNLDVKWVFVAIPFGFLIMLLFYYDHNVSGILQKFVFLQRERRFQLAFVFACVAISQTIAAIGFPVLIILMIPARIIFIPRWFTLEELQVLDDFTVTNDVVLASLGGKPALPEHSRVEDWGLERRRSETQHGVSRQRVGSIHR